jgi:hypothetical protein
MAAGGGFGACASLLSATIRETGNETGLPGAGFCTAIATVSGAFSNVLGIVAVNVVPVTESGTIGAPFQRSVQRLEKKRPATVSVKLGQPDATSVGVTDAITGSM